MKTDENQSHLELSIMDHVCLKIFAPFFVSRLINQDQFCCTVQVDFRTHMISFNICHWLIFLCVSYIEIGLANFFLFPSFFLLRHVALRIMLCTQVPLNEILKTQCVPFIKRIYDVTSPFSRTINLRKEGEGKEKRESGRERGDCRTSVTKRTLVPLSPENRDTVMAPAFVIF